MLPMLALERDLLKEGFTLIHDGTQNPGAYSIADRDLKFFTRTYQGKNGMVLTVRHDLRSGTGDIVNIEHISSANRESFRLYKNRKHNGRDFFVMEVK